MTNVERILALILSSARGLTDREIREQTGITPHQQVNQICHRLADKGLTRRERGPQGFWVNSPAVEDDGDVVSSAAAPAKERHVEALGLPEIDPGSALIVIPCSGRKHQGGVEGWDGGVSILDFLSEDLSDELRDVRERNARVCQVDELLRMLAAERYCGTLYKAAGRALEQLDRAIGGVAIISGGYGVVLVREQIGWYEQRFDQAMWPNDLIERCLSAYAKAIHARTVVGLFGATTSYAKTFRRVEWPVGVQNAWLVSPELRGGGALVKVPRAIGEALAVIGLTGTLAADWKSSDDVPIRITRIGKGTARRAGLEARRSRVGRSSALRRTLGELDSPRAASLGREGARQITISLGEDEVHRLEAVRTRFLAKLAGVDEATHEALTDAETQEGFAGYLLREALDRLNDGDE